MKQMMTQDEAIAFAKSGVWKAYSDQQIVELQLYQDRLCMDWCSFHKAIEAVLSRPVWTHEFARPQILRDEFEGKRPKGTVADSMNMLVELAKGKPIVPIVIGRQEEATP
jgi:hypothetical protein